MRINKNVLGGKGDSRGMPERARIYDLRATCHFAAIWLSLLLAAAVLAGCSGDQGPAGQDGSSFDTEPPVIYLTAPEYGDTLNDTLTVRVDASDNVEVEEVVFYLDGGSIDYDSTYTIDRAAPYFWQYDINMLGLLPGPHTVQARAYDLERNASDTPLLLVYMPQRPHAGPGVIRLGDPDTPSLRGFPTRDEVDSTIVLDSLLFARFVADRLLRIDSVRVWLDTLDDNGQLFDLPLRIGVFRSDGIYPADTLATSLLTVEHLNSRAPGWARAVFDAPVQLEEDERFHVTITADSLSDTTNVPLGFNMVDAYPYAYQNRSGYYSLDGDDPGFRTYQEASPAAETVPEMIVEVYVQRLP
jgi:hypothetical protein